jgi:DmsE family decaheme c-type cytochrome
MEFTQKTWAACAIAVSLIWGAAAYATDEPATATTASAPAATVPTGDAICTRCHDELETKPILSIYQTKHGVRGDARTPLCQGCHGSSEQHLKNKQVPPDVTFGENQADIRTQDAACLTCHKAGQRTRWAGSQHQTSDVACSSCHTIHAPVDRVLDRKTQTEVCFTCHKEQRADTLKVSTHPINAGKMVCADCHNLHGSAGPKLLKKNTVTETCFTCHAEKRGPFLWEHQPVTEDCTNCHTPHGSNIAPLLKSRAPFLCDECHDGPHNSVVPFGPGGVVGRTQANGGSVYLPGAGEDPLTGVEGPNSGAGYGDRSGAGRACLNCHSAVHGSNSPSGQWLHR